MTATRLVLVGAGGMGSAWIDAIGASSDAELVGIVDLNVPLARSAADDRGLTIAVGDDFDAIVLASRPDAVVNVTVPAAHHQVSSAALLAGLPVLSEKPVAPTVAQALSLAAMSEHTGQLLMTSQSRRYSPQMDAFRAQTAALGRLGVATASFFQAPHFGGFREEMEHVLLVDMAIHAFDAARFVLDLEPVSVYCEEFNPAWSWFAHGAAATAVFEFEHGVRFSYTGSWCADGAGTSWNGDWRVNGEAGTVTWDGEEAPRFAPQSGDDAVAALTDAPSGISGALEEFVRALSTGETPSGEVHANIMSLAMVEAAVTSAEQGARVDIPDVLEAAFATALRDERHPAVSAILDARGSGAALMGRAR